jgi:hypothetical protein
MKGFGGRQSSKRRPTAQVFSRSFYIRFPKITLLLQPDLSFSPGRSYNIHSYQAVSPSAREANFGITLVVVKAAPQQFGASSSKARRRVSACRLSQKR